MPAPINKEPSLVFNLFSCIKTLALVASAVMPKHTPVIKAVFKLNPNKTKTIVPNANEVKMVDRVIIKASFSSLANILHETSNPAKNIKVNKPTFAKLAIKIMIGITAT